MWMFLLWLSIAVIILLCDRLIVQIFAWRSTRWGQWLVPGAVLFLSGFELYRKLKGSGFWYHDRWLLAIGPTFRLVVWAWLAVAYGGLLVIAIYGLWRVGPDRLPRAQAWTFRGTLIGFGAALALLLIAGVLVDYELQSAYDRALDASEVYFQGQRPPIDEGENAWPLYVEIAEIEPKLPDPDPGGPPIDAQERSQRLLERYEVLAPMCGSAAMKPKLWSELGPYPTMAGPQEGNRGLSIALDLFYQQAMMSADHEDFERAWAMYALMRRIEKHAAQLPGQTGLALTLKAIRLRLRALEMMLAHGTPVLDGLVIDHRDLAAEWRRQMTSERFVVRNTVIALLRREDDSPRPQRWSGPRVRPTPSWSYRLATPHHLVLGYDEVYYGWPHIEEIETLISSPTRGAVAKATAYSRALTRGEKATATTRSVLLGRLERIAEILVECEALQRMFVIAIAIERHHAVHGAYPESLAEFVPAVWPAIPVDPWTGVALVGRPEPAGFIVYSLGPNQRDDDGRRPTEADAPRQADDIAWRFGEAFHRHDRARRSHPSSIETPAQEPAAVD